MGQDDSTAAVLSYLERSPNTDSKSFDSQYSVKIRICLSLSSWWTYSMM